VHAFLEGTTYRDLVHELERSPPVDSNELFDIATSFTSGEEAVGAIFDGKKGKSVTTRPRRAASGAKRARSCAARRARRDTTMTGTRPSQWTRPERAFERPLEAPACSTTC
jgi:hypothetical protein